MTKNHFPKSTISQSKLKFKGPTRLRQEIQNYLIL